MTISTTSTKNSYTANGSQTVFAYTFKVLTSADIKVYLRTAAGVETLQTLTTHYTLSGVGSDSGGNVTFGTAPASGVTVVLTRSTQQTQTTDYVANDPFGAETHEAALDKLTMISQEIQSEVDRAITVPATDASPSLELPSSTARATRLMAFDSDGDVTTVATDSLSLATLQSFTDYRISTFTGDGSTASFTLSAEPGQEGNTQVFLDGVYQSKNSYNLVGAVLTFDTNIPSGVAIEVVHGQAASTYAPDDGSITFAQLADTIDEDNMASNSATKIPTQQSVKAYVDSQVTAQDLDFQADSGGALNIDLDSESLTLAGGEGIDTAGSGNTVTISGEDASTSNKGIASFSSDNFAVSFGAVTIKSGGVDLATEVTGALPVTNGGTGATTAAAAASALGVGTEDSPEFAGLSIGESTPSQAIHVTGAGAIRQRFEFGGAIGHTGIEFYDGATWSGGFMVDQSDDSMNIWTRGDGSNARIKIASAAGEAMRIDSSGNVGIGTTSPDTELHITATGVSITLENQNAQKWSIGQAVVADEFTIRDETGTANRFHIDGSGNVGIGTISPTNKLEVVGTQKTTSQIFVGSASDDNYSGGFINLSNISRSLNISADPNNAGASTFMSFSTDGSERMRIDSSGRVGIGTTTPGAELEIAGDYQPLIVNSTTGHGAKIILEDNGVVRGYLGGTSSLPVQFHNASATIVGGFTAGGELRPGADNTQDLGSSFYRWAEVFAGTGTINTSDRREKTEIADLDEAERRVAIALRGLVRKYRFKDAVAAKGDAARIHVGVIAQEVVAAFEAEGLDAHRYALLCYDEWDAVEEVLDDDGEVVTPGLEAGNRYGIRYDELLAFIISAL